MGSSTGKEVLQWIKGHKGIVIGVAVVVGLLLLVGIARCVYLSVQRRRINPIRAAAMANRGYYAGAMPGRRSGAMPAPATMSGGAGLWPGQQAWKDDDVSPAASSQGSYDHRQQPTLPRVEYGSSAWRYG